MGVKCGVKAEILDELTEAICILSDEAKLNFKEDCVECIVVDPSHVALVHIILQKDAFQSYESSSIEIGLDLKKMRDFLRIVKATDTVNIEIDDSGSKIVLKVKDLTSTMALTDISSLPESRVPNLTHKVKITVKTEEIVFGIKAAEKITENITFQQTEDKLILSAKGDTDTMALEIPKERLLSVEGKEEVKSSFNLDFVQKMFKVASKSEVVDLHLGTKYPLKIEFDIAGGNGHVIYLLAPRMED